MTTDFSIDTIRSGISNGSHARGIFPIFERKKNEKKKRINISFIGGKRFAEKSTSTKNQPLLKSRCESFMTLIHFGILEIQILFEFLRIELM